ncbi:hypothetical protein NPIL_392501 [Nephila pilipes]|uniref:Uncharacterized protein n=1 Tax=Nephila pilipes TaxID=299642 RepID=A0A8X6N8Y4_NEPPI|nr:hypothetical protein NPIL_392501 [Nephila pilipes]
MFRSRLRRPARIPPSHCQPRQPCLNADVCRAEAHCLETQDVLPERWYVHVKDYLRRHNSRPSNHLWGASQPLQDWYPSQNKLSVAVCLMLETTPQNSSITVLQLDHHPGCVSTEDIIPRFQGGYHNPFDLCTLNTY